MAKGKATEKQNGVVFGEIISVDEIPIAQKSHKYDEVLERVKSLSNGEAQPFQAPSRSSVTSLKAKLEEQGYEMRTRTNKDKTITVFVNRK